MEKDETYCSDVLLEIRYERDEEERNFASRVVGKTHSEANCAKPNERITSKGRHVNFLHSGRPTPSQGSLQRPVHPKRSSISWYIRLHEYTDVLVPSHLRHCFMETTQRSLYSI